MVAGFSFGCGSDKTENRQPETSPEATEKVAPAETEPRADTESQGPVQQVIEQATGIRAAREGEKLKNKINAIDAARQQDIEEALEE